MGKKNSWLDYMYPGRGPGNSYQNISFLLDGICSFIKKLFNGSVKSRQKPVRRSVREMTPPEPEEQDDTPSVSPELTVNRQGSGPLSRGKVLSGTGNMPEISGQMVPHSKNTGSDRQTALRNAVLWSEILGEPAAKKRQRKRVSQYYGDQGNAD